MDSTGLGEAGGAFLGGGGMELDLLNHPTPLVDRWYLHRNEPWCVVGEHRHWPGPLGDPDAEPPPLGDDE